MQIKKENSSLLPQHYSTKFPRFQNRANESVDERTNKQTKKKTNRIEETSWPRNDPQTKEQGGTALKSFSLGRNRAVSASNPCQPDERSGRGEKAGATLRLIIFSRSYSRAYLLEARLVPPLSPLEENRSWKTSVFPPSPPLPTSSPPLSSQSLPTSSGPCSFSASGATY